MWHSLKKQTADFDITLRHTQKFSLSTSRATICSPLLSLLWLPSACGHNTAQRPCPTLCTAVRTSNRPAGNSPSFFPTSGWPLKLSRMGRKSMLRGRWPSSGLTLPGRAEVESVPNKKNHSYICASSSPSLCSSSLQTKLPRYCLVCRYMKVWIYEDNILGHFEIFFNVN